MRARGFDERVQIVIGARAARAVRVFAVDVERERRTMIFIDQLRRDESDHAAMPASSRRNQQAVAT
jgi:DNA primase